MVGVKDDGDTVDGSHAADVVGSSNGTSNGGSLAVVANTLTGEVSGTTLGHLQDDGGTSGREQPRGQRRQWKRR